MQSANRQTVVVVVVVDAAAVVAAVAAVPEELLGAPVAEPIGAAGAESGHDLQPFEQHDDRSCPCHGHGRMQSWVVLHRCGCRSDRAAAQ